MAEAFGIAGSAFGTVSLGFQLFKEISQYLDDIDGREGDLKEARNYATNIQLSLNALDVAISNAPTGDATTKNAIDSCKASCISAVNNLLAVVKQLRGPTITLPNGNAARAKELCVKLKYPFKKQNMEKLEESLSRTNIALQTILQVFQLHVYPFVPPNTGHEMTSAIDNMHQAVADLNVISGQNKKTLDEIHKTSQVHDDRLGTIQQDVRELLILTRDSNVSKILLRTMAQQILGLNSRSSADANLLQNPESEMFIPSIQTTSYQGGGSMASNALCSCKTQRTVSGYDPRMDDNTGELLRMLTLISEPTSCARKITAQDRNQVQQLLEKCPSYINESNYCGQSPVHLAIDTQNIAVISIVLYYADAKALRARDNMGYYPIDYVTNAPWKLSSKEPRANCEGCKVLEILLQLETPLFSTSLRAILRPWCSSHGCVHSRKIIIKGLAERRERLKELWYQSLLPAERESLEVHHMRILDRNAARVQHQLEAQGCTVPAYLSVYEENIGSSYDHQSIYSLISDGEVAEYAHQLGFYYSDSEFMDFICSLAFRMSCATKDKSWTSDIFSSSHLSWMLDHGTSISSRTLAGRSLGEEIEVTAAHYFKAGLGLSSPSERELALNCPVPLAGVEIVLSETIVDRCRCWCCPGGCTPLAKLLEGIFWSTWRLWEPQQVRLRRTERLVDDLLSTHQARISDCQWIYAAIIRYYTFTELGLRHSCCSFIGKASGPLPEEEFQEIEDEDSPLLELFEIVLIEFEDSRRHDISLGEFFEWMRMDWAPRMREVREILDSQELTDEQLRDAESIGVVWEFYGPKPTEETDLPEWRGFDLWDAMDQLDLIATDPERPTRENLQTYD
ncbi:hypothetical protein FANTH_5755 [Fusarium anthophilum]|uniref:Fungal N-terminal domain-containing protein n=1 Tax=Fusarium anthophilum TaxID=48485 RepID=A0A8H4ZMU1_9HYPO|nr:hypothetical protein FANTH_5755 [Fusarium anthophilum]